MHSSPEHAAKVRCGIGVFRGERSGEIQQVHPETPRHKQVVSIESKRGASEAKNTRGARVRSTSSRVTTGVCIVVTLLYRSIVSLYSPNIILGSIVIHEHQVMLRVVVQQGPYVAPIFSETMILT